MATAKQHYISHLDDWNPHIVRNLQDAESIADIVNKRSHWGEKDWAEVRKHTKEFRDAYARAQKILSEVKLDGKKSPKSSSGMFPLAYRLEPVLSDELNIDPIKGSKFGGIPFLNDVAYAERRESTPEKQVELIWPRCGGCHEYMNFLGGVDLSDWLIAIHSLTKTIPKRSPSGRPIAEAQRQYHEHSGLGFGKSLSADSWPLHRPFWNIFYCIEDHYDNPSSDSRILISHVFTPEPDSPGAERKKAHDSVFDPDTYTAVMKRFMEQHLPKGELQSNVPLQTVKGWNLRFDIDTPGNEFGYSDFYKTIDAHPGLFDSDADYSFFGRPRSQQTSRRPACSNTYDGTTGLSPFHRMGPLVNWLDNDRDYTRQIYSCLRCLADMGYKSYAKTDGSCT